MWKLSCNCNLKDLQPQGQAPVRNIAQLMFMKAFYSGSALGIGDNGEAEQQLESW